MDMKHKVEDVEKRVSGSGSRGFVGYSATRFVGFGPRIVDYYVYKQSDILFTGTYQLTF